MIAIDFTTPAGAFTLEAQAQARTPGVVGVFGPSGAGKTTLLRAIAGLAPLSRGAITLDGAALDGPPDTRRVAYVFQDSRLFPHLTVRENLLYGLKRAPAPHKVSLGDVVDSLDIAPLLHRHPRGLSGGEQKRVALGRALLSQPRIMLLDEPLAGLDDARKAQTLRLVSEIRAHFAAPMLLVSHDLNEVAALSDDLWLMEAGRITHAGAAGAVFADPATPLADRPDARTLIDAVVAGADAAHGVTTVSAGAETLTLPWTGEAPGSHVRLQVYARDVTLAAKAPEAISTQNVLPAAITGLRARPDRLVLAALDTPAGALFSTITQQAAERLSLAPGAQLFALVKATAFAPR